MKIAFWSNAKGKCGTTSNLAGISGMLALEEKGKMVLLENHQSYNCVENALVPVGRKAEMVKEPAHLYGLSGMEYLLKKLHCGLIDAHTLEGVSRKLFGEQLRYIPHSQISGKDLFEYELYQSIEELLGWMDQQDEIYLIDTEYGGNLSSKYILEHADLIVVNLCQSGAVLNQFFEQYQSLIDKSVFLLGNYHPNSRYSQKNILRKYQIDKKHLAVIPYNMEYHDALEEGTVLHFLERNMHCSKRNDNYIFMRDMKKAVDMIWSKILEYKEMEEKNGRNDSQSDRNGQTCDADLSLSE